MKDILTEEDVAEILGCEIQTIQEKARSGELPGVKFGRPWRFPRTALLEALHTKAMANKSKAAPAPVAVLKPVGKASRQPPVLPAH
ncbi:MAG: helix-turn-helix domain-containing protein [Aquabacterium sp.]|nr:helix-turn-helix domain-containing protein [Aquabacterium sp.]